MKKPTKKNGAPETTGIQEELATLCIYLRRRRTWVRAREIRRRLGIDDRKLRVLVEHAEGKVLSAPGSNGYRFFNRLALRHARPAIAATRRQIDRMTARACDYEARLAELGG